MIYKETIGHDEAEYTQDRLTPVESPPKVNVRLPRKQSRVEAEAIRAIGFDDGKSMAINLRHILATQTAF